MRRASGTSWWMGTLAGLAVLAAGTPAFASGGATGGADLQVNGSVTSDTVDPNPANNSVTVTVQVKAPSQDTIKVTKAYTNATPDSGGQMLIKASSSDTTARLFAYRPDGVYIGEVQNGGGSRYGGTVMPYQPVYPASVTIQSSSGGSITVPTTPFQI